MTDEEIQPVNNGDLLVAEDIYLTSGVHIGTQQKSADMRTSSTRSGRTDCTFSTSRRPTRGSGPPHPS